MKQFIVLAAVLPLLLLFVAQYALDMRNEALMTYVETEVEASLEQARAEGIFSAENKAKLLESLSGKLGIASSSIIIEVPDTVVYRINYFDSSEKRGLIPYRFVIPIGKAMATGLFSLNGNTRTLTIEGTLASEKLP